MGIVKMRVWDVKHGNAIYIKAPNGKNLVFDLGRGDYSDDSEDRSPLETLRDHYRVSTIEMLTITHPHKDHIDDILNIDDFTVSVLARPRNLDEQAIMNGISDRDKAKFERYFKLDKTYTTSIDGHPNDPSVPPNYGGLSLLQFETANLTDNLNDRSIFTVVLHEGFKIIIPGDNEWASLDQLMRRDDFLNAIENCDVLIAPHHGRESAYHANFVTVANPLLTIISDGSVCDTSANPKYSAKSRGWSVWYEGIETKRKLLTTNFDGEIYLDFGTEGTQRVLQVVIK